MLRNSQTRYGAVSKGLHGLIAVLVIAMLCVGFFMNQLPRESNLRPLLLFLHKSTGVTVLALVILRVCWTLANPVPSLNVRRPLERYLARSVHLGLYLCMLTMPVSGYLMATSGTRPFDYFGWFPLPRPAPNEVLGDNASWVHTSLPWVFIALIGLHLLGVLKHQFIDRDQPLKRMWRD